MTELHSLPNELIIDSNAARNCDQSNSINSKLNPLKMNEIDNQRQTNEEDMIDEGYSSKFNLNLYGDNVHNINDYDDDNDTCKSLNFLPSTIIDNRQLFTDDTNSIIVNNNKDNHRSIQINSFNPQYSLFSMTKSQLKPELYQLAFDVQMEDQNGYCDDDDDQQACSGDWSTVNINDSPITTFPIDNGRMNKKQTIVTAIKSSNNHSNGTIWMTQLKNTNSNRFLRRTLPSSSTSAAPAICCCSVM